jgi:hypothetical protein
MTSIWLLQIYIKNFSNSIQKKISRVFRDILTFKQNVFYWIRLTPPTVDHAPVVNKAPVAVVLVVNCPLGNDTIIAPVAPTGSV